ncbi:MAG: polyphosphate polymerase domain-containing protein [Spirochaetaceae bacterium]
MSPVSRFERKYILDIQTYYRVRNAIAPFTKRDYFSRRAGGKYLVRSIYYDTRDYRAWYEKEDGNFGRIKLRIRAYTENKEECDKVSVELKTKSGNSMKKYSSLIDYSQYEHFVKTGSWPSYEDETVCEFERLRRVRQLVPVCLVQYQREGFASFDRSPVRITMDHNVVSTRGTSLFPEQPILKPHRPKRVILEIKTQGADPAWVTSLVKHQMLSLSANSKYWQGIEIVRPNMVTPRQAAP